MARVKMDFLSHEKIRDGRIELLFANPPEYVDAG